MKKRNKQVEQWVTVDMRNPYGPRVSGRFAAKCGAVRNRNNHVPQDTVMSQAEYDAMPYHYDSTLSITEKEADRIQRWVEENFRPATDGRALHLERIVTEVIFRRSKGKDKELVAIMPYLPASGTRSELVTCYAHVGQHSGCDLFWTFKLTAAADLNDPDVIALKRELESAPYYYHFRVMKRVDMDRWRREVYNRKP